MIHVPYLLREERQEVVREGKGGRRDMEGQKSSYKLEGQEKVSNNH